MVWQWSVSNLEMMMSVVSLISTSHTSNTHSRLTSLSASVLNSPQGRLIAQNNRERERD